MYVEDAKVVEENNIKTVIDEKQLAEKLGCCSQSSWRLVMRITILNVYYVLAMFFIFNFRLMGKMYRLLLISMLSASLSTLQIPLSWKLWRFPILKLWSGWMKQRTILFERNVSLKSSWLRKLGGWVFGNATWEEFVRSN